MADQKLADDVSVSGNDVFSMTQKIDGILAELSCEMRATHLAQLITPFDGNPRALKQWFRSISHYQRALNANDAELCKLAYETTRGIASKLIEQYFTANPQGSWDNMRAMLIEKLTPYSFNEYEFPSLEELRQGQKRSHEPQGKETR